MIHLLPIEKIPQHSTALTLLSISLVGLTAATFYQLIELIPLKVTVQQKARELVVGAEQIKKLADEKKLLFMQNKKLWLSCMLPS